MNVPLARSSDVRAFYLTALGCREDPRVKAMGKEGRLLWANLGLQQFHLPHVEDESGAQRVRGIIGVVSRDLQASSARLAAAAVPFLDVEDGVFDGQRAVEVACPFGNRFRLHQRPPAWAEQPFIGGPAGSKGQPVGEGEEGGGSVLVGVLYVELWVPRGAAEGVAGFWRDTLACGPRAVTLSEAGGDGLRSVRVRIGPLGSATTGFPTQWLLFCESDDSSVCPPWDGHHLALYLSDFQGAYRGVEAQGCVYDPGRFTDRGGTWELAQEFCQFRAVHVPRVPGGVLDYGLTQVLPAGEEGGAPPPVLYSLELELRSLQHPACPL